MILGFVVSHLAVHLTALLGIDAHLATLKLVQRVYRNPVVEPLLIAALLTQVGLGLRLGWTRWRSTKGDRLARWQLMSDLYLAFFILNHTGAVFYARYGIGLDTNFYWASGALIHPVAKWIFYPYYALAILAVFVHVAAAIRYRSGSDTGARVTLGSGTFVAALILAAFGGWLYPIVIPAHYQNYYDSLLAMAGL